MLFNNKNKINKKDSNKDANKSNIPGGVLKVADVLSKGDVAIRDIVAPSYVEVDFNHIKIDAKYYRTLFVVGYPR